MCSTKPVELSAVVTFWGVEAVGVAARRNKRTHNLVSWVPKLASGPSIGRIDRRHCRIALYSAGDRHEAGARARSAIRCKDYVVVVEDGLGACSQKGERDQTKRRAHRHARAPLPRLLSTQVLIVGDY